MKQQKHVYLVHCGHTQFPMGTSKSGGVKQPICHPLKQQSQTNLVVAPCDYLHNMHCKHARTMANDGSIGPSTCGR
jgi:hypothetical protein